jgi:hypothetical protein
MRIFFWFFAKSKYQIGFIITGRFWPRGWREVSTNVASNTFYHAVEGQGIVSGISDPLNSLPEEYKLYQNYPNLSIRKPKLSIQYLNSQK